MAARPLPMVSICLQTFAAARPTHRRCRYAAADVAGDTGRLLPTVVGSRPWSLGPLAVDLVLFPSKPFRNLPSPGGGSRTYVSWSTTAVLTSHRLFPSPSRKAT
ncbi:hypothetical protein HER10_EVM0005971 [Colletotrichum scovillei]|uniref:uncharacterized protein n=1 Tax=Colletotrichum scovillei TaxID=1209932 RepID=UPI0015C3D4C7|nr:uncharacterized protein HER10_EVM0005971 [Colletotrichum scovillei]KAF4777698.1 hypothetical protein HER10_EVM0005971 [Colletotrichum scovillei]